MFTITKPGLHRFRWKYKTDFSTQPIWILEEVTAIAIFGVRRLACAYGSKLLHSKESPVILKQKAHQLVGFYLLC